MRFLSRLRQPPADETPLFDGAALKRLILPLILEQTLAITVGMADTVMVSSLGDAVMSGVSLIDNINTLIINIFAAFATGGAVVAAQFLGARREKSARETAGQVIVSTLLISLAVMGVCLALREPIIRLLFGEIEPEVMASASVYFRISAFSYPVIGVYSCCAALFRTMGNSKVSMYSGLLANVVNIGANALFIYGMDMGAAGAALGSLLSRLASMALLLVLLTDRKNVIYISFREKFVFNGQVLRKIFRIGLPNSLENGVFQLGRIMVLRIITLFGVVQIAANGVANSLSALGCIPGQAMNLAMITVVGRPRAGALVYAAVDGDHLSVHDRRQRADSAVAAADAAAVFAFARVDCARAGSDQHPQRLRDAAVDCRLHAAERAARGLRRAVYDGYFGRVDAGLPHRAESGAGAAAELRRGRRFRRDGRRLAVPRGRVLLSLSLRPLVAVSGADRIGRAGKSGADRSICTKKDGRLLLSFSFAHLSPCGWGLRLLGRPGRRPFLRPPVCRSSPASGRAQVRRPPSFRRKPRGGRPR